MTNDGAFVRPFHAPAFPDPHTQHDPLREGAGLSSHSTRNSLQEGLTLAPARSRKASMRRTLRLVIPLLALAVAAAACSSQRAAESPPAPAAKPPVAVAVTAAALGDFTEIVEVVGALAPKFSTDVKSEVTGTVTAVYVTEWVRVERGSPLARLDTTETEAAIEALRAGEAQARTAEARARREHERAVQLKHYGLITPQNFDDATTAVEAAESVTSAARAQVRAAEARLRKSLLRAPMDGVLAMRAVNVGDRVENMGGGILFRIVDTRLLDLTVSVPSTRLARIRLGQRLEFQTDSVPGRIFRGKVMFVNPVIDEASRSAKVVAEVPNPDGVLKGGAFVTGHIVVASRSGVLRVPREALTNWQMDAHAADVFVVRGDTVEKASVETGTVNGSSVEIRAGLQAGDRVVTRGGFALRSGDRVTVAHGA